MPYRMPEPRELVSPGWRYGFIKATPRMKEIKCLKGTSEEYDAELLLVTVVTAVPDEENRIECEVEGTIFLHSDLEKGGSNLGYLKFLQAIGIEPEEIQTANGPMKVLPDPDVESYVGKPVKIEVYHDEFDGRYGPIQRAKVSKWETWDGINPENGKQVEKPKLEEDDIPF